MNANNEKILFTYIQDKNEPLRVLTVARQRIENTIYFSYCINKVATDINRNTRESYKNYTILTQKKEIAVFDFHNKKRAREIVTGRLKSESNNYSVTLQGGESPLTAVLYALMTEHHHKHVSKIAKQAVEAGFGLPK
jgi:Trm5-related predicted tRNA methylase